MMLQKLRETPDNMNLIYSLLVKFWQHNNEDWNNFGYILELLCFYMFSKS